MRRFLQLIAISIFLGSGLSLVGASTIKPLSFTERVEQAVLIVRGTVVDLETFTRGPALQEGRTGGPPAKESQAPRAAGSDTAAPLVAGGAPVAVGVEGGSMLFTRVTLAVEEEIVGISGQELIFQMVGGSQGDESVIVAGLPRFELGRSYLLFLRPGFEDAGDPIVGVNQGFFEIVRDDATGGEFLLDANGDFVLGIEDDRVVARHNSERASRPAPRLAPPPSPEAGSPVRSATSAEVLRYWQSSEPPLSLDDFTAAVFEAKEVLR